MTDFIDKDTVIEAVWLNGVDATVYDVLDGAATDAQARVAIDVPQETPASVPQVRVNGAWQALSASAPALHAASHASGGADQINHNTLLNGAGTTHTDHASVTITAGSGLTGGGTIESNVSLAFSYLLEQAIDAGGFKITNLQSPAGGAASDVCTKGYADNLIIEAGANPWLGGITPDSIYYSTGYVGIGTDTPIADLDVRGTGQITGAVTLSDDVGVGGNLSVTSGNLDVSGEVGIGTNSPSEKLEVVGAIKTTAGIHIIREGEPFVLYGTDSSDFAQIRGIDSNYLSIASATGLTEVLNIHTAGPLVGNVGIGTPSPAEKLHVDGNIQVTGTVIGPDTDWKTAGVTNCKYRKLSNGVVEVRATVNALLAGTLPSGYRPSEDIHSGPMNVTSGGDITANTTPVVGSLYSFYADGA